MTSVTDTTRRTARATEGARRATGVALAHALAWSPHRVVVLLNCPTVDLNLQLFQPHVDARHHVLVDGLRGQTVLLSKDVQPPITPDEAHQMIAALLGLGQRILRSFERPGETNSYVALLQGPSPAFAPSICYSDSACCACARRPATCCTDLFRLVPPHAEENRSDSGG